MKLLFLIVFLLGISSIVNSQCNQYQIYESFTGTLPTQGGTWTANSMIAVTSPVRTGTHAIGFNGSGDWIRTPQMASPGILNFWYRRSSNSTAWTLNVQTSPNGTTWTTRGSITTVTTTYQQYTLNIGALSLTNIFIRLIDARSSGAHERYVEDLSITSTAASSNILLPILGSCTQTLNSSLTYNLADDGGPAGPISTGYSNNVDRTLTLTPSDNTLKLQLSFTQMDLETSYDYLYVYDGPTTSATLLATLNGTVIPSDITATNSTGQLTIRWTSDVSNIGAWGGFMASVKSISVVPLPVELLYFEGDVYPSFNSLKWATASEQNSSHFIIERSTDGYYWREIVKKPAAENSNQLINYYYLDNIEDFVLHYYRLIQCDIDGTNMIYGPIAIDNREKSKKVVKWINMFGQEVSEYENGVIFIVYEDGSTKKVIR
jgi:hypothetical protein